MHWRSDRMKLQEREDIGKEVIGATDSGKVVRTLRQCSQQTAGWFRLSAGCGDVLRTLLQLLRVWLTLASLTHSQGYFSPAPSKNLVWVRVESLGTRLAAHVLRTFRFEPPKCLDRPESFWAGITRESILNLLGYSTTWDNLEPPPLIIEWNTLFTALHNLLAVYMLTRSTLTL